MDISEMRDIISDISTSSSAKVSSLEEKNNFNDDNCVDDNDISDSSSAKVSSLEENNNNFNDDKSSPAAVADDTLSHRDIISSVKNLP